MSDTDFEAFFTQREAAGEAYVNGNFSPLDAILPTDGDASFHSPRGDSVTGAEAVATRYRTDASSFAPGGKGRFEILQKGVSGDLAFWSGFQVATVKLKGRDELVEMRIRVTEAFRRINGEWKLIHRHADMGAKP